MAEKITCPVLTDVLTENDCLENFAGLGTDVYIGLKSDLETPMTLVSTEGTTGTYSTPVFKAGKGLYKVQCADDKQQVQGSSLGFKNGFEITGKFTYDAVNKFSQALSRAVNNLKIFIIFVDGDDSQIMYDPQRNVKFDNGGITSDTGAAPGDERVTNYECKLSPVRFEHLYVTPPIAGGWDSLLASAKKTEE